MNIPTKKINDFALPVIGLGTWGLGGFYERDYNNDDARDVASIQAAISLGVTHLDTAEIYGEGQSEILIGRAIKGFDRSKLTITSKVHPDHGAAHSLLDACQRSLERLQIDYLDLYLLHAPSHFVPIEETMTALAEAVGKGYVKQIGVSNFNGEEIARAQKSSAIPLVNNQIHYSLEARGWEADGTVAYCQRNGVLVTAYRPLSQGKMLSQPLLTAMAKKYDKTPAQVALNWLITKPGVVTLVKCAQSEHLTENLGAIGWELDEEDIVSLNTKFPRGETAHGPRK